MNPTAPPSKRIRTILYDDQRFYETELDLLHTPALQRLYELHQLGLTDRVFIDASHSRLHHVVGVVEQADNIMSAIIANLERNPTDKLPYGDHAGSIHTKGEVARIARKRIRAVRVMAMLHDITHAPYGHTLEDEILLVPQKHDEPARQADAFYRLVLQYFGWIDRNEDPNAWGVDTRVQPAETDHYAQLQWYLDSPDVHTPPCSAAFIVHIARHWGALLRADKENGASLRKVSPRSLAAFVKDLAFAMRGLLHLDLAHRSGSRCSPEHRHFPDKEYPVDTLLSSILREAGSLLTVDELFDPQRDVFLLDVIGNTICADLLDYARRDSVMAGLKLDYDPNRIIANMTVVSYHHKPVSVEENGVVIESPFAHRCLRTAISVFTHKLRTDIPGELLNLLQVRYYVYERMLYHPTKSVGGALLGAAIQFIGWKTLPVHLRFVGDDVFRYIVAEAARTIRDLLAVEDENALYDQKVVDSLCDKLRCLPVNSILLAARALVEDRLPRKVEVLKELTVIQNFPVDRAAAKSLAALIDKHTITAQLNREAVEKIRAAIIADTNGASEDRRLQLLHTYVPTIGVVHSELKAGIRLLDRLGARRFHKSIFRLLPDVQSKDLNWLSIDTIAELFQKPIARRLAEREIERRAHLPAGTVVLHCPKADGPAKIANILITDGELNKDGVSLKLERLNDIGKLNERIFQEHENAVHALEKMYRSTWRLAVSVARPHESKWPKINKHVGEVLFEMLSGGDTFRRQVENDGYMRRELEEFTKWHAVQTEAEMVEDISRNEVDPVHQALQTKAWEILAKDIRFAELIDRSSELSLDDFMSQFKTALNGSGKAQSDSVRDKIEFKLDPQPKPRWDAEAVRALLDGHIAAEGFEAFRRDKRFTAFVKTAKKLQLQGQHELTKILNEAKPDHPISWNQQREDARDTFFRLLDDALTKAIKADRHVAS